SSSVSPSASFRGAEKHRNSTDYSSESKKQKTEEKEIAARYNEKSTTPVSKSNTPTPRTDAPTPGSNSTPGLRPVPGKPPGVDPLASSLRTPMAVPCPYPTPFGIVPHAGMNGELTSPGAAYAGLHNISPQMSAAAAAAAAAAAYGRSPVVGFDPHHHMRVPAIPP
ncbi:TLE4 isoform 27, partial [Pan troglodytes]